MANEVVYTDSKLLDLIAHHDHSAFKGLYRRYWSQLYDAAFQRLKDHQQAEDIVQEIFVSLWKRREALQVDNLAAYLHTAVRNRVLNYVVRNKAPESFYEPLAAILLESTTADTILLQKELLELLKSYIETLPEKRKQVFVLHLYHHLSTKEIAEKLQISQKTVQNQLRTAMADLKTKITPLLIAILTTRL
jgi:RNA polymerase sigma-70 factor (family 1)